MATTEAKAQADEPARAVADETPGNTDPHLRFRADGTFRVMQFADIQDTAPVNADTLALMEAALDAERPDLVVLTGDQIKGYAPSYRHMESAAREAAVREAITQMCEPMIARGIPFAATYGNHDCQCGVQNARQDDFYAALPWCLNGSAPAHFAAGAFMLPVLDAAGKRDALAVYLVDSGGAAAGGGYEAFPRETVRWMTQTAEDLSKKAGRPVPGIVFQHIPLPQLYDCLRLAMRGEGGVPGYRTRYQPGHLLVCREDARESGELHEPICCPDEDSGEFEELSRQGSFFAAFFGHDHKNTLVARCGGMQLGYAPTVGFSSYGPGVLRAARLFVLHEENPAVFETRLLDYQTLVGGAPSHPVRDWFSSRTPVSVEEARELLRAPVRVAAGIAISIAAARAIHAMVIRKKRG